MFQGDHHPDSWLLTTTDILTSHRKHKRGRVIGEWVKFYEKSESTSSDTIFVR
jgi:hypothetical protein